MTRGRNIPRPIADELVKPSGLLNVKWLEYCCISSEEALRAKLISRNRQSAITTETPTGPLLYIDNGSPILGIAHLDVSYGATSPPWEELVRTPIPFRRNLPRIKRIGFCAKKTTGPQTIFSGALDDRLGVYVLTCLLPTLHKIRTDWLFTTGEECRRSTAQYFKPPKNYNWIYSFDRQGTGAVVYFYNEPRWVKVISNYSIQIVLGIYSDIVQLTHLGVCGLNMGTGYYKQHTNQCYCTVREIVSQAAKFANFYRANCRKLYPWTRVRMGSRNNWHYNSSYGWHYAADCPGQDCEASDGYDFSQSHGGWYDYNQET